jgi:hypothetical protein
VCDLNEADNCIVPNSCFDETVSVTINPPNIMFVLDKSGSMTCEYGASGSTPNDCGVGGNGVKKWDSLHTVVSTVVTNYDHAINMGAKLFPRGPEPGDLPPNGPGCEVTDPGVDSAVMLTGDGASVLASIPAFGDDVYGGTPTGGGVNASITHLQGLNTTTFPGAQSMILIMDDDPGCIDGSDPDDPDSVINVGQSISAAFGNGITTYVVGIDFETTSTALPLFAAAGGSGLGVLEATDTAELTTAIETIITDAVDCTFPVSQVTPVGTYLEIEVADSSTTTVLYPEVPPAGGGGCPVTGDGYVYNPDAATATSVTLCNAACDTLKSSVLDASFEPDVQFKYFCEAG